MERYEVESDVEKLNRLKVIFLEKISNKTLEYYHKLLPEFSEKLKQKYTSEQYQNCKLWHLIIGSTLHEVDIYFDTPDNDIENFILNELE